MPPPRLRRRARRSCRPLARCAFAIALAAGLALGATACGGGDDEIVLPGPTAPTPPLTQEELTEQANAVCREATRQIAARTDDNGPTSNDAGSGQAQAALVAAIEPVAQQAITTLRYLTPPPADAALVDRGWDKMSTYLEQAKADPSITIDPIGLVDRELYDYGFTACFTKGPDS